MTVAELHSILDDPTRKITKDELTEVVFQLKQDVWDAYFKESNKEDANNYKLAFYDGEGNAFRIVFDLIQHLTSAF